MLVLVQLMGVKVLQVDVWLEPSYACALYESCKSTNIVGSVTGMQSGLVRHTHTPTHQ